MVVSSIDVTLAEREAAPFSAKASVSLRPTTSLVNGSSYAQVSAPIQDNATHGGALNAT